MHQRFLILLSLLLTALPSPTRAADAPLVLDPPVLLNGATPDIRYHAQPAKDGKIDLTATNGFFDRCFQALDQQPIIPGDDPFIGCSFASLGRLSDTVPGTARWHLWCPDAGQIQATFFMQVPPGETNHPWIIQIGDEKQPLPVNPSDGQSPQAQTLTFTLQRPGHITFSIDCTKTPPPAETRIRYIHLEGSALAKASLLRTRWRPAAVHARFSAPDNCPAPTLWVFETMDVGKTGSYSPLTTPFGYFGTSFDNGGRIPPGAGFNFSMWIANRNATQAPPIEKMARLIATDLPEAQYSTFGGEGSGVKFRSAAAYKNGADRTIQALRIETTDDGLVTYFGYFYDEQAKHWKLYASAQAPAGRKNGKNGPNFGTLRSTGSFCEIPGPPTRQRSGDLVREIKRRGWFYGSDQKWYCAQLSGGDIPAPARPNQFSEKRIDYMDNYATEGWMAMAAGGIELHAVQAHVKPPQNQGAPPALPSYLTPESTAQLFDLPVVFGPSRASDISPTHATLDYEIKKTGPNSKAILYYGPIDSLTYPAQKVTQGSPVEIDMHRPERTWQSATPEQTIAAGMNQFKIDNLKPSTPYFYRLFVTHDQGKSWDYHSSTFKTPSEGSTPGN